MLFMAMCSTAASTASTGPPPTVASPPPAGGGNNPLVNVCNQQAAALPTGAANNAQCAATAKQVPTTWQPEASPPLSCTLNLAAFSPITTCTHLSSAYHVLCSDLNKCYNKVISGGMSEGGLIALVIAILLFIGVLVVAFMYKGVLMAAVTRAPRDENK